MKRSRLVSTAALILAVGPAPADQTIPMRYRDSSGRLRLTVDHDVELRMAQPMKASRSFAVDLDLATDPEATTWKAVIGTARGTSHVHGTRQRLGARHLTDTDIPLSVGDGGSRVETADRADPRTISLGPIPRSGFSVTSALADALPILSDAPVKVGSTWTTERPVRSLETWTWGQGQLTSNHRVTAIETRQGRILVKIATESRARLGPVEGEGPYNGTLERTLARAQLANARTTHARVDLERARVGSAAIRLGYTEIRAPIRGVIADVGTREGETVAASFAAPTFVRIIDLERLEVQAYVDETDIGRIFLGQPASFTVDTYPDAEFTARVSAINPKAELQNGVVNYIVLLGFDPQPDHTLRPEMTAHVRLQVEQRPDVLTLPRNAVRRDQDRSFVTVRRGDRWIEQQIRPGWRSDRRIEIEQGLAEGEIVQLNAE